MNTNYKGIEVDFDFSHEAGEVSGFDYIVVTAYYVLDGKTKFFERMISIQDINKSIEYFKSELLKNVFSEIDESIKVSRSIDFVKKSLGDMFNEMEK